MLCFNCLLALSIEREHFFSNTDLSDLSIVNTCSVHVYQMRHEVM